PVCSTVFPYTTLFRSQRHRSIQLPAIQECRVPAPQKRHQVGCGEDQLPVVPIHGVLERVGESDVLAIRSRTIRARSSESFPEVTVGAESSRLDVDGVKGGNLARCSLHLQLVEAPRLRHDGLFETTDKLVETVHRFAERVAAVLNM